MSADDFDTMLQAAVAAAGGNETKLAKACGVSQNAIWAAKRAKRVSAELAVKIEAATGGVVPRWKLRPDLWDKPSGAPVEPDRPLVPVAPAEVAA